PINRTVEISINRKVFSIGVCKEVIEGSFIKQFDDFVNQQRIVTKVSEASSGINFIPEQSLNWVSETLNARRVHSPAR
ncbi:hypothetical protein Ancab_029599, partial [Ancistrocladus abbreviatus]